MIGYQDGDIFISLNQGHKPTADYVRQLRKVLPYDYPSATFSFLPADIVSQILNSARRRRSTCRWSGRI